MSMKTAWLLSLHNSFLSLNNSYKFINKIWKQLAFFELRKLVLPNFAQLVGFGGFAQPGFNWGFNHG